RVPRLLYRRAALRQSPRGETRPRAGPGEPAPPARQSSRTPARRREDPRLEEPLVADRRRDPARARGAARLVSLSPPFGAHVLDDLRRSWPLPRRPFADGLVGAVASRGLVPRASRFRGAGAAARRGGARRRPALHLARAQGRPGLLPARGQDR